MQVKTLGVLLAFAAATAAHAQAPVRAPDNPSWPTGLPYQVLKYYTGIPPREPEFWRDFATLEGAQKAADEWNEARTGAEVGEFTFGPYTVPGDPSSPSSAEAPASAQSPDRPMPSANDPPAKSKGPIVLEGSTFEGDETRFNYGKLRFVFKKNRAVTMTDKFAEVNGTWNLDPSTGKLTLHFYNRTLEYAGTLSGSTLAGDASDLHLKWTWNVRLIFDESTPKSGGLPANQAPAGAPALPYQGGPGRLPQSPDSLPGGSTPLYRNESPGGTLPGVPSSKNQPGSYSAPKVPVPAATNFSNKPAAKPAQGQASFNPRLVFDESAPKNRIANPGGVSMPIGIDQVTLQRGSAPSSLIDAIRSDKK